VDRPKGVELTTFLRQNKLLSFALILVAVQMGLALLAPWPAVFAGFAILFLSFGFNLLGDALRDTLDPRLRQVA
jgi:ABC-type dipeptide/oligopeptide/nickel transport system permease subunit